MTEFNADHVDSLPAEGGQLDDPASFVRRLSGVLAMPPN
jgi:hypothetical protein